MQQLSIGQVTLRTVIFSVGAIFFLSGLGYDVLSINAYGKLDIVLFGVGGLLMLIAIFMRRKVLDH